MFFSTASFSTTSGHELSGTTPSPHPYSFPPHPLRSPAIEDDQTTSEYYLAECMPLPPERSEVDNKVESGVPRGAYGGAHGGRGHPRGGRCRGARGGRGGGA
ncbi:hypothetical protein E2562_002888 [Oryza meyeriana var. granulata]|uniref:Uncharacterized protein n=1 Tax=Oryza meyeriana var. granulata TaxID=110450 RepID=A0A6G1DFC1_9ORYZ|nr:hypothetical protein E2562_002888 [Oryza meyeriana var. granulata]